MKTESSHLSYRNIFLRLNQTGEICNVFSPNTSEAEVHKLKQMLKFKKQFLCYRGLITLNFGVLNLHFAVAGKIIKPKYHGYLEV